MGLTLQSGKLRLSHAGGGAGPRLLAADGQPTGFRAQVCLQRWETLSCTFNFIFLLTSPTLGRWSLRSPLAACPHLFAFCPNLPEMGAHLAPMALAGAPFSARPSGTRGPQKCPSETQGARPWGRTRQAAHSLCCSFGLQDRSGDFFWKQVEPNKLNSRLLLGGADGSVPENALQLKGCKEAVWGGDRAPGQGGRGAG